MDSFKMHFAGLIKIIKKAPKFHLIRFRFLLMTQFALNKEIELFMYYVQIEIMLIISAHASIFILQFRFFNITILIYSLFQL